MAASLPPPTGNRISAFFSTRFSKIREINGKYRTPRIKTTRAVTVALLVLRLYLFLIIGILLFKFISTLLLPT